MLILGSDYPIEKYKDYKNRTIQNNIDKTKNQLWGIKQNSLKPEDKEKVRQKMIELINEFKF
jgi:hypothetical protein